MDISFKSMDGPLTIVALSGDMDLYCATDVKISIQEYWKKRQDAIILDLGNLNYLDSSGIGTIIKLFSESKAIGVGFGLSEVPPQIRQIMELTKLIGFLPLFDTVAEAVGKLNGDRWKEEASRDERGPLLVNSRHSLFSPEGMNYRDFNIDFGRIRYLSHLISQKAPPEIREFNLLEQQISEIVKNAVRHGNRNDIRKKVKIWYSFTPERARLIIEDEGRGFQNLEEWNGFFRKRMEYFVKNDFYGMTNYISYRTADSSDDDGGNALFAAVEYWNDGVVYNEKRNAVAVGRTFAKAPAD